MYIARKQIKENMEKLRFGIGSLIFQTGDLYFTDDASVVLLVTRIHWDCFVETSAFSQEDCGWNDNRCVETIDIKTQRRRWIRLPKEVLVGDADIDYYDCYGKSLTKMLNRVKIASPSLARIPGEFLDFEHIKKQARKWCKESYC
tara:strand:- start:587 stop:1021 length:435 start_codon:yes stop_codon:yes gene_type:complete